MRRLVLKPRTDHLVKNDQCVKEDDLELCVNLYFPHGLSSQPTHFNKYKGKANILLIWVRSVRVKKCFFLPFPKDPFPKTFSKLKSDNLTFPPNLIGSSLSETDDF